MRLRCRGSEALGFLFLASELLDPRERVELEPEESHQQQRSRDNGRKVKAKSLHQRSSLNSMYMLKDQAAIPIASFAIAHGNVNDPLARRSSSENVNQRTPNSRVASEVRSPIRVNCAFVNFIATEATSAFASPVKSSTQRGFP